MRLTRTPLFAVVAAVLLTPHARAEAKEKDGGPETPKTIAELTQDSDRIDGLFTMFRDRKTGAVHMLVEPRHLGRELIYLAQSSNGVPAAAFIVRGTYLANDVITLHRYFDRVEFVAENTAFYFDPASPLARAADANRTSSLLAVEKILAEDAKTGAVLIGADKLFTTESLSQIKPSPDPEADPKTTYTMGSLSEAKSKVLTVRSYPLNTDVEVEYVYEDPAPRHDLLAEAEEIKDPRNVAIRLLHSFIAMPDAPYEPRRADPRVGFFSQRVTDLTVDSATPWRDVVKRWKLVKRDPAAAVSEPVEPIVWWIENTTPYEWRDTVRDATLAWNAAFERAGFKNAIVVKVQPDDAGWDAGDVRYNVLRWTSSPSPIFGGYGPSFVNPRDGQILGADIMLEFSYVTARLKRARVFPVAATASAPDSCSAGHALKSGRMLGQAMATAMGLGSGAEQQMLRESLFELVLHEVGHTLGLQHNFKASTLLTPAELFDPQVVAGGSLSGSVMDYPAINFAPPGRTQTAFYSTTPGPYDFWAIEYGYSPALPDPAREKERLEAILARSSEPGNAFGNDADDMRSPGAGIDPRVNIYDLSSDPVAYSGERFGLLRATLGAMPGKFVGAGRSRQELLDAFKLVMVEWRNSAAVVSRQVGGVLVDRDWSQAGPGSVSYRPVGPAAQRGAMLMLSENVFAPDAFPVAAALYASLQPQPRQFDLYGKTEDPKIHDTVLEVQKAALDHLLHPVVLKRIMDSRLYGNGYPLADMMTELTDAVFAADLSGDVNSFRQSLQMEYVDRLAKMVGEDGKASFGTPSRSMALHELVRLREALGKKRRTSRETRAHTQGLLLAIDRALTVDG